MNGLPGSDAVPGMAQVELTIAADGTLYARNLTPEVAALLALWQPGDPGMAARAALGARGAGTSRSSAEGAGDGGARGCPEETFEP